MTAAGFTVIDCHHHVGSLEAQGMGFGDVAPGADPAVVELERRLAAMDRHGVDQAIVIPGHGYQRPDGVAATRRVNDAIARYRDQLPDRFPAALGIAEPLHGQAGIDELTRMRDELGLVGLSVHARFQGVQTDSPLFFDLIGAAAELGLVPFIHVVEGVPDEALWRAQRIARSIPETPVVILVPFAGTEHARQAIHIAQETPNMVFDTSTAQHWLFIDLMIKAVGHERVVFGTDYYSMLPVHQHNMVLDEVLASDLSDEAKAAVLAGNLQRILGLGG